MSLTIRAAKASLLVCLLSCAASGCVEVVEVAAPPAPQAEREGEEALIYGADDRREWYQLTDPGQLSLASATVGVFQSADVSLQSNGTYLLDVGTSFGAAYGLCSTEPYRAQPSAAFCSGFQVGDDLIATAGHCVDAASCGATTFVFGFHMTSATTARANVPAQDVYRCAEVIARAETSTNDFALVRVDRAISGHAALPVRRSGAPALGTALVVAGHPAGIPLKVAGGATVRANSHPDYISANLDTYGGNSGSPVLNPATGEVEGILVRGNTDFIRTRVGGRTCYASNVCADAGCPGWEDVTRASKFVGFLPEAPPCASNADCDDNNACNGAEACDLQTGACAAGAPLDCDDSDACTADACDPTTGCVTANVNCDDGDACTVEFCDSRSGCGWDPVACDDGADGCCSPGCEATDPDCDGPACGLRDAPCAQNADCCSGSCNRRKGICR
jgi:hypothetical protein